MKRITTVLTVFFLLIGLVAVFSAGCGGKSSAEAADILEKSNAAMQAITTFSMKMDGSYKMEMMEGMEQDIVMEMRSDMSNPQDPKAQIVMSAAGMDMEMYLIGNYTYMEIPGQGWVKTAVADMSQYSQMTPSEISKMSKGAEDIKIVSEKGGSYEISFKAGEEYIQSVYQSEGVTDALGEEMSEMMADIYKNVTVTAVLEIDKKTLYVTGGTMKMEIKDAPMIGTITADIDVEYTSMNEPLTIELPPEAAAAPEVDAGELGTTPGLPGIPI